jgi:carbonic anhydrase/acetyltransferase-like protein (isoleucine patch superfamily)
MFRWNPEGDYPQMDSSAYIDPTVVIIGRVTIGKNVFVGSGAVIRADEPGSSITIKDNCNIQDRVIIHALENTSVSIEENTSLAHGCIIHGPCKIGKGCFVGFGSVIFNAELEEGVLVKHLAVVEGVEIFARRVVGSSQLVGSEDEARELMCVGKKERDFMEKVIKANLYLIKGYKGSSLDYKNPKVL